MTYSGYQVRVPGKLLIAGEYAVLEPKQQAIVIAVNRYITVNIEPSEQNLVSLPQLGIDSVTWEMSDKGVQFNISNPRLQFIQNALTVANQFLQEKSITLHPIHLTIKSELNDPSTGRKYGLGSSAAVVVAVISAVLSMYCKTTQFTLEQIFKLSAIAHLKTQKNGSGVDIAASIFGGWLCYSAFNQKWVLKELQQGARLSDLINKPWPNLSISSLKQPANLKLRVGWTNKAASTAAQINKVKQFRARNLKAYTRFLNESSSAVARLLKSFEYEDCLGAISSLTQNRNALKMLSEDAGIMIETPKLTDLCRVAEKYGSGKSSGAGGGDCGIAFMIGEKQIEELHKAWQDVGITPLNLSVSQTGVSVTEYNCAPSLTDYLRIFD